MRERIKTLYIQCNGNLRMTINVSKKIESPPTASLLLKRSLNTLQHSYQFTLKRLLAQNVAV